MKLYVLEPYPVGRHMGASHTKIARPRGNSKELLCPTKLQFMVKNEWWTYPDIPFPIFIYLFIYLFIVWVQFSVHRCFGLHWKPQEYFWVLNLGYGKRISFRPFFLYSKLSVLNTLKWDLYVLLVRLKSVIYTPTLAKRPKRSSRSSAHRHWRPFS